MPAQPKLCGSIISHKPVQKHRLTISAHMRCTALVRITPQSVIISYYFIILFRFAGLDPLDYMTNTVHCPQAT